MTEPSSQKSGPASRTYEATILVKASAARADYEGAIAAVRQTYEAAYPIGAETSALYLNAYFTADPLTVERIERRAKLGETILRQLIVSRPGKEFERIKEQRAKAAANAAAAAAAAAANAAAGAPGSYEA